MAIVSLLKLPFLLPQSLDIEATDGVHFVSANRNANINDTDSSFAIVMVFALLSCSRFPFRQDTNFLLFAIIRHPVCMFLPRKGNYSLDSQQLVIS